MWTPRAKQLCSDDMCRICPIHCDEGLILFGFLIGNISWNTSVLHVSSRKMFLLLSFLEAPLHDCGIHNVDCEFHGKQPNWNLFCLQTWSVGINFEYLYFLSPFCQREETVLIILVFFQLSFCHSHLFWFLFLKVILNKSRMECKLTLTLYEVKVTVILVLFDILCSEAHQRGTINAFCPQNNWIQDFTNISTSCSPFPTPCCIFALNVSVQGASFIFVYFLAE